MKGENRYSVPYFPFDKYGLTKKSINDASEIERARIMLTSHPRYRPGLLGSFNSCHTSWLDILNKRALHVFIESKELFDFLSTQEVRESSRAKEFALKNGRIEPAYNELGEKGEITFLTLVIHHKYTDRPSLVCSLYAESGMAFISTNVIGVADEWMTKLLINTIFYIEAFPDCVIDGTPDEVKSFNKFYGATKRMKLKTHESLIDRSSVTPHFRSGYFKTLSSAFYKKKRGQVVFVHSTFVKGKAVTVLDDGVDEIRVNQ